MADKAISQYQTKTTLNDEHYIQVGRNDSTYNISVGGLKDALKIGMLEANQSPLTRGMSFVVNQYGRLSLQRIKRM